MIASQFTPADTQTYQHHCQHVHEHFRRQHGFAEDAVITGCELYEIETRFLYRLDDFQSFAGWLHGRMEIEPEQIKEYRTIRVLPVEYVRGRIISLNRMVVVVKSDQSLWKTLCEAAGQ